MKQLIKIINYLQNRNILNGKNVSHNNKYITDLSFTIEGWLESEKIEYDGVINKNIFIAMDFSNTKKIRKAIKDGIVKAGYEPVVIDEKIYNKQIVPEIFTKIRNSKMLIIDATYHNYSALKINQNYLFKSLMFIGKSAGALYCPWLVFLFELCELIKNCKDDQKLKSKLNSDFLKIIDYIDLKTVDKDKLSEKQCLLSNNLLEIYFKSVERDKKEFILNYLKGLIHDEDKNIDKYPIEPINRIIRDISIIELDFLKKYNSDSGFMLLDKDLSNEKQFENVKQKIVNDGNVIIYLNSDDGKALCSLVNLGLVVSLNALGPNYIFTKVAKDFISILEKLRNE